MTTDSDWRIDTDHWPGPVVQPTIVDMMKDFSRAFHMHINAAYKADTSIRPLGISLGELDGKSSQARLSSRTNGPKQPPPWQRGKRR